ncbi:MAG: class I SAM-dependent methyltransferase [Sphingomonadales bacterium]|nr:class I SAM-dependent methyltransferase [Sphingomonadales bacterium]
MYLDLDAEAPSARFAPRGLVASLLLRGVRRALRKGRLSATLPDGRRIEHAGAEPGRSAAIHFHTMRALRRILRTGDIGFAEGYIAGEWTSPDLVALLGLFADNITAMQRTMDGFAPLRLVNRLRHVLRGNTARGAKRNIAFHYDLGNDFYRLWLDASMTYSSARSLAPGETLEAAQAARLAHIEALLALSGTERVLEIGCGWGALAARLAARCEKVTAITLSREQLAFTRQRCAAAGLANVEARLQDYREVGEVFDRIVSIEMLEAVGEAFWSTYFERLRACLAPGGTAVLQVITMREDRFASYRLGSDFIQHYIFPGGMLPTAPILRAEAGRAGLRLVAVERFGAAYAATLAEWRRRFRAAQAEVAALGFDERFRRIWTYYLCYCEAGFRSGTIDVGLYVLKG